jgi:hypothetical protein
MQNIFIIVILGFLIVVPTLIYSQENIYFPKPLMLATVQSTYFFIN